MLESGVETLLPHSGLFVCSKASVPSLLYCFLGPAGDLIPKQLLVPARTALQATTEGSACVALEAGNQGQSIHCALPSLSQLLIAGMRTGQKAFTLPGLRISEGVIVLTRVRWQGLFTRGLAVLSQTHHKTQRVCVGWQVCAGATGKQQLCGPVKSTDRLGFFDLCF